MSGNKLKPAIPPAQRPQVYGYNHNRTKPQSAQQIAQNNQNARDNKMYHIATVAAQQVYAQQNGMIVPDDINSFPVLAGDHPDDDNGPCPQ